MNGRRIRHTMALNISPAKFFRSSARTTRILTAFFSNLSVSHQNGNDPRIPEILVEKDDLELEMANSIASLAGAGDGPGALTLFKTALTRLHFPLDLPTCNVLMASLRPLNQVLFVYKEMIKADLLPNADTLHHIIRALVEDGRIASALDQFRRMHDKGCAPSARTIRMLVRRLLVRADNNALSNVVAGFCRSSEFAEALELLEKNSIREVESYNVLLTHHCDAVSLREAMHILEKMVQMGIADGRSWNIVIRGICDNSEGSKALEIAGRMISSSRELDPAACSAIIVALCKARRYESALKCFRRISAPNGWLLDPTSYDQVVLWLCQEEMIEEAAEVFSWMSRRCVSLDASSLDMLIDGVCRLGKVRDAITYRSLGFCCGTCSIPDTFASIIRCLPNSNKPRHLLLICSQMIVEGCILGMCGLLMQSFCAERMTREILILFRWMISSGLYLDSALLDMVVNQLFQGSVLHTVVGILIEVVGECGGDVSPVACNMIISGLVKEGCKLEARRVLELMLERGWVPDGHIHNLFVGNSANIGELGSPCVLTMGSGEDEVASILEEGLR